MLNFGDVWPFAAKHIMMSRFLRKMYPKWSTSWWFQIFFTFTPTWGNDPFWLIFSKWVGSTTNQSNFPMPSSRQHEDVADLVLPVHLIFEAQFGGGISLVKDPTHRRWHLAWKSILDLGSAFRIGGLSMCSSFFKERSCLIPFWWLKKKRIK